jgi:hypothetical protein
MKRTVFLAVVLAVTLFSPALLNAAENATNTWTGAYATAPTGLNNHLATQPYPLISGNPPLFFVNEASKTAQVVSHENPLPAVGTFSISSFNIYELDGLATWGALDLLRQVKVNLASFTAPLPAGENTIGSIGAIVDPLPSGTNILGLTGIDQTTPGVTNGIQPASDALGSASSNTVAPLGVQILVSDNTDLQRVLAPIILGDGVNGNNMLAVGGWVWNGTTWDRAPGNSSGAYVIERPYQVASTTIGTITTAVYTITWVSGVQEADFCLTETDKEVWLKLGGDDPAVLNGRPIRSNFSLKRINPSEVAKLIASESIGFCLIQR